ncbi:hypothetical protein [Bacillus sp. FJAT-26390]|uniref:hypothetical protein n=1 Tax=Bacillus sp. FJAT-26390 TaxID=1743142 RepID=UPI000807C5F9|nr:hypothetical protein [Bacillus sp. FJAT-26390]OBZ13332.1 hypothetical protein A7975_10770 [Bacillus sp. FJAT-26390]
MYPTSQAFKDAGYASTRNATARVMFDISDVSAVADVIDNTVTTEHANLSQKAQVINKKRIASYNLATLEQDRFRLDGTFSFPDALPANNGETGYVSNALCGADGVFSPARTIAITFGGLHSSAGITVTFDQFNNEYATDFNISTYNAANALIKSVDVTGNTLALYPLFGPFDNYKKIIVTINKWSVGNRRARVLEVDFGYVRLYTDNEIIRLNMVEEMDMTSGALPSPEFRFSVDNSDRVFNILNPAGYVKYLQQRQEVVAEIGFEVAPNIFEFVPVGRYLLSEWASEEGSLLASFTARTNLDLMANYFMESLVPSTATLAQVAILVFNYCGIKNFSIDPALNSVMTSGLVKKTDCRTIIQMVAIAGCCNIFVTRDNVITLKRVAFSAPAAGLDFDNMYTEPKIELEGVVKRVDVNYWTTLETSGTSTVTAAGVDSGEVLKLEENTLINSSAAALTVANWILAQRQYRAKYSANWRGDPSYELGDVISIENSYGSSMTAMITKTEIDYEGYLQARTEAKGAVN